MDKTKNDEPGSTQLLSEILRVLKRIDGHLDAQEGRINTLDSKITALTDHQQSWVPGSHTSGFQFKINSASHENLRSGVISPPISPFPRPRDLRHQIFARKASVESRGPRDSIVSGLLESEPDHEPHYGKTHQKTDIGRSKSLGSTANLFDPSPTVARSGTWNSVDIPPTIGEQKQSTIRLDDEDPEYSKARPPDEWITTRSLGRILDVKYGSPDAEKLWTKYVGDSWMIPPDGRVELTFQRHLLERLDEARVTSLLQTLKDVSARLDRGSFRVSDFGFDPNFEESVIEYRAEFLTGKYKDNPVGPRVKGRAYANLQSAFWKRMIEIRGLSKILTEENETWTGELRDPFTEAMPTLSAVCPFLTDRERNQRLSSNTGMNLVNQALLHHQKCWRHPPPCDDNLSFHITFYEIVDLTYDNELDDELWRSGRLHSDDERDLESMYGVKSRRIRESACTIVLVPDPKDSEFWTSIYLCPNNFDLYDKIPGLIAKQNAQDVLLDMIEFTMHMVIVRWRKVEEYFSWLIGHRDTLADLEAHDSLLFDDDTFSRSRKYFWAINYLAELDISIAENIVQLERFTGFGYVHRVDSWPLIERLGQLNDLRSKLKAQRDEAIALRDGLFSASGVMESRASTRLGENVKLLTFVSIFFLPLSFCMSVWSINNTIFSMRALIITVILVGIGTYLVVFNLNNFVGLCARFYDRRKRGIIKLMKEDEDMAWSEQGKRFEGARPKQERLKPSEWMILLFVLHRIAKGMHFRRRAVIEKKERKEFSGARKENAEPWMDLAFPDETLVKDSEILQTSESDAGEAFSVKLRLRGLRRIFKRETIPQKVSANV